MISVGGDDVLELFFSVWYDNNYNTNYEPTLAGQKLIEALRQHLLKEDKKDAEQ